MYSVIIENGIGTKEEMFWNNCIFSKEIASKKWTKKYLSSEDYNSGINLFLFSKYNLSDILYCALSVEEIPKRTKQFQCK
jgi:hypothetical protein